ncbi:hypothetical protein COOONC_07557 [Cooperia oncophora]
MLEVTFLVFFWIAVNSHFRSSGSQQIRARELSVVGLPIYSTKRCLVEAVVDAVAAIARGDEPNHLFTALAALVSDGLKDEVSSWSMIRTVTAPGPATKDVYSIVNKLDSSEKSENSRVEQFFEELFRLLVVLCYFERERPSPPLFTRQLSVDAPTAYRTLLWRLVSLTLKLMPRCLNQGTPSRCIDLQQKKNPPPVFLPRVRSSRMLTTTSYAIDALEWAVQATGRLSSPEKFVSTGPLVELKYSQPETVSDTIAEESCEHASDAFANGDGGNHRIAARFCDCGLVRTWSAGGVARRTRAGAVATRRRRSLLSCTSPSRRRLHWYRSTRQSCHPIMTI